MGITDACRYQGLPIGPHQPGDTRSTSLVETDTRISPTNSIGNQNGRKVPASGLKDHTMEADVDS
jgi:hypothetical protein